jgi:Ca2+-binding EF-hand superfamily protein
MFLRLVKSIISQERQIEALRECLFSDKGFNLTEAFRFFDVDGDGLIDETELAQGFAKHNIEIGELSRLVSLFDENKDGKLGYREF